MRQVLDALILRVCTALAFAFHARSRDACHKGAARCLGSCKACRTARGREAPACHHLIGLARSNLACQLLQTQGDRLQATTAMSIGKGVVGGRVGPAAIGKAASAGCGRAVLIVIKTVVRFQSCDIVGSAKQA